MAIKTIPITDEEVLELYHKVKVKFVTENPRNKITNMEILKDVFKNYLGGA
jgi:hypothetical protein